MLVSLSLPSFLKVVNSFYLAVDNLKGTSTLMYTMFYNEDLYKPCNLIPISSESVEKCGSCGRLNICNWTVMEAAIL